MVESSATLQMRKLEGSILVLVRVAQVNLKPGCGLTMSESMLSLASKNISIQLHLNIFYSETGFGFQSVTLMCFVF